MRLAIINQFYPPDFAPTGRMAASLAEHRAMLGDQVTVLASRGGYVPESPIQASNKNHKMRVMRLWTPRLGKDSLLARIVDYSIFLLLVSIRMTLLRSQDVIIAMTTPPFIGLTGTIHKRLHRGAKLVLWNMDCYPEALERAGAISETGLASRIMRGLNRHLNGNLDHQISLDSAMQQLLQARSQDSDKDVPVSVIHNWEPAADFPADQAAPPWEKVSDLDLEDRFIALYLGNAGFGHRFETVIDAAAQLRDERVSFLFVGGGEQWDWLQQVKIERDLQDLHLCRYVPESELRSIMTLANCSLVTLRDSYLGVISPSKIHSSLAMGLPLVYIGPAGGNVDEAIRSFDCGVSLRHGDVEGLVDFIRRLMQAPDQFKSYKGRARKGFEAAYSDATGLPEFDRLLEGLAGDGSLN